MDDETTTETPMTRVAVWFYVPTFDNTLEGSQLTHAINAIRAAVPDALQVSGGTTAHGVALGA